MDTEELLAQLADIHLPGTVSLWPPAFGWWLLLLALVVGGILLGRKYVRYKTLQKICGQALTELDRCYRDYADSAAEDSDSLQLRYVNEFNSVIRRVALYHFPQDKVASLGGAAWVDFIREKGDSSKLNDDIAAALSYGRFQTQCEVDVDAMNNLGQQWIASLYLGKNEAAAQQGLSS